MLSIFADLSGTVLLKKIKYICVGSIAALVLVYLSAILQSYSPILVVYYNINISIYLSKRIRITF